MAKRPNSQCSRTRSTRYAPITIRIKESLSTEQKTYAEERQIFELEKKLAVNRSSNESLQRELSQSEEDTITKRKELEELQAQLEQYKAEQEKTDFTLKQLIADEEARKQQVTEAGSRPWRNPVRSSQETRTLDAKKNEYELTKSLVENLEGFPESIKFLKKNAKWSKEAPLLSDIIYCAEEYRVAIENLSGAIPQLLCRYRMSRRPSWRSTCSMTHLWVAPTSSYSMIYKSMRIDLRLLSRAQCLLRR
jgi:hypothetical protein